jgi:hypothetical protein
VKKIFFTIAIIFSIFSIFSIFQFFKNSYFNQYYIISKSEYTDKVYASWLGQIIGNIYGLPHECQYIDEPRPENFGIMFYQDYYLNRMKDIGGSFSDDDTDIEYMYLLQMEKHGIEPSYSELVDAWKYHVRDRVWLANRAAIGAMRIGLTPPLTGSKNKNPHWFQIDPQLVNEIWAVTSPGMTNYACGKSAWAAKITNDDWGIEPTIHYAAMYSSAFFEKDIKKLISIGLDHIPENGVFYNTVKEVINIFNKYPDIEDWKKARKELSDKFYFNEPETTKTMWNANLNGACGILALLYGDGDFIKTLDIAAGLGFDADNQTATMSGLLGIINGTDGLPENLMYPFKENTWDKPFNDFYKNVSRYDLPDIKISKMVEITVDQAEKIIVSNGGEIYEDEGQVFYKISKESNFNPKLEISFEPNPIFQKGTSFKYKLFTSYDNNDLEWDIYNQELPEGVVFENGTFSGIPEVTGNFKIGVYLRRDKQEVFKEINLTIFEKNIALEADKILSYITKTDTLTRDKMWITVGKKIFSNDVSIINDGKYLGDNSVFYSINDSNKSFIDYYGYEWDNTKLIGNIVFRTGSMEENGGWFKNIEIEYINDKGNWEKLSDGFSISPEFDNSNSALNKSHFVDYLIEFSPINTKGIRITGYAGGGEHWHELSKNSYFTSITELEIYPPLKN